jgi:glycerol uptake facilitator protein
VLGAFAAAAILWFVYQGAIANALHGAALSPANVKTIGGVFYTSNKPFVGTFGAFGDEFLGTALLVGVILVIVDSRNQPVQGNLNPLIIGFLVVAIGTSFGLNSGYALNPARDFGPRLWITLVGGGAGSLNSYTWIPIVAPLAGGVAGAFIFDLTIGKILQAKTLLTSGTAETQGVSVREPTHEPTHEPTREPVLER